jgi:PAS domain S-box-containing protein
MLSELDDAGGAAQIATAQSHDRQYERSLIEANPDALAVIGQDGKIIDVNAAMLRSTGLPRAILIGTDFAGYFTDTKLARELCALVRANGIVASYPLTLRHADGHFTDVIYSAAPHGDAQGTVRNVLATGRDVTASQTAELRFRTFIESAPDAMILVSGDGKILLINRQTEHLFGYRREELLGLAVEVLVPERFRADHPGHRSMFVREPRLRPMGQGLDLWGRRKDGGEFPIEISLSPIESPAGLTVGATVRDVTIQKTASRYARSLLEASLDPLVTISPEGKITDVNEATIKVTGVARERLVGTDFCDYFTEPERAREGYRQVFADGSVTDYPLTIRHEGGNLTDVLYNASVYKDSLGNVLGVFAAARDVTEAKRFMRQFAETRHLLDNVLQSSTKYSIIGKDLDHRILSWNEGARRNYGYEAAEILGRSAQILHAPEDLSSGVVQRMFTTAYETGLAEGEFERVRQDRTRFWANVVITRRNDAEGNPIGFLLMSNDISERKQAEEQARATSQYARSLIEASLDPLVTINPGGKITDVNEATAKVTGVPREKLIGTDFSDYFTEPENAREGYQQVFAKGAVTDFPLTIRHRSQTLTEVMYNATVYKDVHGNVLGVFAGARDITAQRRAEREIAEQRAKDLERLAELERFQKLTVGRELKMIELKKEIQELKKPAARADVE